ncbi:MAG: flagellar transcriptional regulator FlhD [Pseudomonadales bacterium]|nr:flagellar transcriptional regulator FlhD [Pseudomonadales bacterium]
MKTTDVQAEIHELNLTYLLLAQRLLNEDRVTAMFRLKLNENMADLLVSLSAKQLSRLSRVNQFLFRLGFDQAEQMMKLISDEREPGLAQTHTALLLSQPL